MTPTATRPKHEFTTLGSLAGGTGTLQLGAATRGRAVVVTTRTEQTSAAEANARTVLLVVGIPFVILLLLIIVGLFIFRNAGDHSNTGPVIGQDLHAVFSYEDRTFVSGHTGAAFTDKQGRWSQIEDLEGKDAMAWTATSDGLLVGGHGGLYRSADEGLAFQPVPSVPEGTDVHAVGGRADVVYISTPDAGFLASTDGGLTFSVRGARPALMGGMVVDAADPNRIVAADMRSGVVLSADGGRTWKPLAVLDPEGAVGVAQNPTRSNELLAVGISGGARSTDAGRTWDAFALPDGAASVTFTPSGLPLAAVLEGDRARLLSLARGQWVRIG